jgi:hypothetical protein
MILFKKLSSLVIIFLFGITGVFAQFPQQPAQPTEVSDTELKQFASAYTTIQSIQEQLQNKMAFAVQNEGLDVQKFNEILNAQQDPNKEADASEEELEKFDAANKSIEQIQNQGQKDIEKVITDNKLTVPRYQEIMSVVQSDPELQTKLQKLIEDK